ncbi:MAG: hypothetical protein KA773_18975 [Chloroflexi bacterium]|nr:hypothetical protein [Chloroflexota bacterium]
MSVIHGRFVGRNDREFVLRTGRDDETTGGGRIYAVSEEAAANLRRIMAERKANEAQAHRQKQAASGTGKRDTAQQIHGLLAKAKAKAAAARKADDLIVGVADDEKEAELMKPKMTDEQIIAAHRRYVLENMSIERLSKTSPGMVAPNTLYGYFVRLKLPIRNRARKWQPEDAERVCQVHDLKVDRIGPVEQPESENADVPVAAHAATINGEPVHTRTCVVCGKTMKRKRPFTGQLKYAHCGNHKCKKVVTALRKKDKAVVTQSKEEPIEPRSVSSRAAVGALPARQTELTAVIQSAPVEETAVATNGDQQPGDLREQLTVIQELLALAEAKQVTLSGKISVDLHAEVSF